MAPRPSLARRTLAPQGEHIYELGVVGRKTGVTVPDSGIRDEHGMEPIENLFSSPAKSDHEEDQAEASDDYGSGEEDMDLTTGSGLGPETFINGHGSRLPVPSRVRSPAKKLLNSPAQRNRLIARNSSSPARGAIVRDDSSRSSSQPTGDQAAAKRRLNFQSVANGGPHSLSQPVANGRRLQPLPYDDDEEEASEHGRDDDEVNDFVEESMAILVDGDNDYDLPAPEAEPAQSEGEEEQISMLEDDDPPGPAARKKPGRPPKQKEAAASKPMKAQRKPKPVVEEQEEDDHQDDEHGEAESQEEEEPTARPSKHAPGRRGRPLKAANTASAAPQPSARASKKRRLLDGEEVAAAQERSPEPQPKRQRTSPATTSTTSRKPAPPKKPATSSTSNKETPEPPATTKPAADKGKGRKRRSSVADPGDVSQVAIARRPPLPKSRGLLINRRTEVPGDPSSSMLRTRSGRTSFKPLAYWRNERVEFEKDEAEDAFAGGRTHKPKKFVLPSVKEVVRVDEPEPEVRPKSSRRGGAKQGGLGKRGKRRRSSQVYDEDEDDGPAEVWELDPGTVTGEVVVWQPEYEFSPPAPNDLVSVMDKQLAISGAAIKTTEVVGGEFRYAKVFSEGFIGAGVVDLPPGAIKRLKNSRKVFMIFFVHVGRVLVTVQETSFRISKGGIFIVPRYNEYTIENDYDHAARIFFAQGQEMPASLPPEQDAGGNDGDGDGDVDEEVEVSEGEEGGSGEE
ncbi:hypothetical protein N657DRAFT_620335 [Parathielavia appendiculata]|uniref:CENP-C homolog n=1 Tax=Parathielavia appendiculata TaxID=2587402 RepID=A0AAN6TYJ9_9PEZI|nr:hypothetical protein N657DRAFT_620335 [Parathielavia appendiculata]